MNEWKKSTIKTPTSSPNIFSKFSFSEAKQDSPALSVPFIFNTCLWYVLTTFISHLWLLKLDRNNRWKMSSETERLISEEVPQWWGVSGACQSFPYRNERGRIFEDLPTASIVSVLRPDTGDFRTILLSYTIEFHYKQAFLFNVFHSLWLIRIVQNVLVWIFCRLAFL